MAVSGLCCIGLTLDFPRQPKISLDTPKSLQKCAPMCQDEGMEDEEPAWRRVGALNYLASEAGEVCRIGARRSLKATTSGGGTPMLRMRHEGGVVKMSAARAIGLAFHGEPPPGFAWRQVRAADPPALGNIAAFPITHRRKASK